jgi:hypothetical protein
MHRVSHQTRCVRAIRVNWKPSPINGRYQIYFGPRATILITSPPSLAQNVSLTILAVSSVFEPTFGQTKVDLGTYNVRAQHDES